MADGHAAMSGLAKFTLTASAIPRPHSVIAEAPGLHGPLGVQGIGEPARERVARPLPFNNGGRRTAALWHKRWKGKP